MAFSLFSKKQPPKPEKAQVKAVKAPAKKVAAAKPTAPKPVVEEEGFSLDFTSYGVKAEEKPAVAAPAEKNVAVPNIGLDFSSMLGGGPASAPATPSALSTAAETPAAPVEEKPQSVADSMGMDFSAFIEKAEAIVDAPTPAVAPTAKAPTPAPAAKAPTPAPAAPVAKAPKAPAPSAPVAKAPAPAPAAKVTPAASPAPKTAAPVPPPASSSVKPVEPEDLGLEYTMDAPTIDAPAKVAPVATSVTPQAPAKTAGPKSVAPKAATKAAPAKAGPKSSAPTVPHVAGAKAAPVAQAPAAEELSAPNSVLIVEVESGQNEVPSVIETSAMLFANGQPQDALDKLDKAIAGGKLQSWNLPAWLMRFHLYQELGRKGEFEEKALDFVVKFERSPPAWIDIPESAARPGTSAHVTLSGPLSAASAGAFNQLRKAAEKQSKLRVDFAKLESVDAAGCTLLLETLKSLRAAKKEVYISGEGQVLDLVRTHTVAGDAQVDQCFWLLLLDLYQQLGMFDEFEEAAVDFAVTYEVSPPSWEARPRVQPPPPPKPEAAGARDPSDDSFRFEGEIAGQQDAVMSALTAYVSKASPVMLDFARTRRIDFVNAGRLAGVVEKAVEAGKPVVLRGAGEMTIALFAVLGLHQRARIIPRK